MAGFLGTLFGILTGGGSSGKQVQRGGFDRDFGHDVSIDDDLTVFDLERVQLNERGEVAGFAASIGKDGLELRTSKLPEGIEPSFGQDVGKILNFAKCVCRVFIEEGDIDGKSRKQFFATAFFVSETKLLTAGHNIAGVYDRVTRISVSVPGTSQVLSREMSLHKIPLIDCKLVGTLYKRGGPYDKDIAILDSGSFRSAHYVQLSSIIPPKDALVDVIGYPGEITREWIEAQWGLKNHTQGAEDAKKFLRAGSLTVTRGKVEDSEETMSYHISTSPGMGGSCVLYQGCVIAVHIGQSEHNIQHLTMALSFKEEEVSRFLRKYGVKVL